MYTHKKYNIVYMIVGGNRVFTCLLSMFVNLSTYVHMYIYTHVYISKCICICIGIYVYIYKSTYIICACNAYLLFMYLCRAKHCRCMYICI